MQQLSRWKATARWPLLCGPAGPSSADEARSGELLADEAQPGELPADEARLGELSAEGVRQGELPGLLVASAAPGVHLASPADADRAGVVRPGELSASLLALLLLLPLGRRHSTDVGERSPGLNSCSSAATRRESGWLPPSCAPMGYLRAAVSGLDAMGLRHVASIPPPPLLNT